MKLHRPGIENQHGEKLTDFPDPRILTFSDLGEITKFNRKIWTLEEEKGTTVPGDGKLLGSRESWNGEHFGPGSGRVYWGIFARGRLIAQGGVNMQRELYEGYLTTCLLAVDREYRGSGLAT